MITIIIPTFNRFLFVARSLNYYLAAKCPYRIVIADSSDDPDYRQTQDFVRDSLDDLLVEHKRFPRDFSNYQCMESVLDTVTTPFVAVIGDDDMLIPESLAMGAEFLSSNPDYSGVVGDAITVRTLGNAVVGPIVETGIYATGSRLEESSILRVQKCIEESKSFDYALMRCGIRKASVRAAVNGRLYRKFGFFGELANVMILAASGKIHKLERLMLVRQIHLANSAFETSLDLFDKICDPEWPAAVASLLLSIETALASNGHVDAKLAAKVAKQVVWTYVNRNSGKALVRFGSGPTQSRLATSAPRPFFERLKNSIPGLYFYSKLRPWSLPALTSVDHRLHADFSLIRACIENRPRA